MALRSFYLTMCLLGTLVPWFFFGSFFAANGLDLPLFLGSLFANGPAAGFSVDVLISLLVFWVWAITDARQHGIKHWWLIFPASFTVGLSLALPLYLYLRSPAPSPAR